MEDLWTATKDPKFGPDKRPWGGETFPGATTPNGMVQLSPVTKYGSGGGYQYEDLNIYGFAHTAMGHWNLLNVPMLPVTKGAKSARAHILGYAILTAACGVIPAFT